MAETQEEEIVRLMGENTLDSESGRNAYANLQLLLARKQGDAAQALNNATDGLRRATVWLTVATFIIAAGTLGQLGLLVLQQLKVA